MAITSGTDRFGALNDPTQNTAKAASTAQTTTAASTSAATTAADTSQRFLKLLVTQMQNQDPLNPMDNAQVTSQMAQISTVSGIQDLNTNVTGLNAQFAQSQALQAASLVGHGVTLAGNKLDVTANDGSGIGGFNLESAATNVKVTVADGTGKVVDTLNLGAAPAGMNGFQWNGAVSGQSYTFAVSAVADSNVVVSTPLMRDHVNAVAIVNNKLTLETTYSGAVAYSDVKAVN
jgi:flagellar basal-body rod modification protein FlgD